MEVEGGYNLVIVIPFGPKWAAEACLKFLAEEKEVVSERVTEDN